MKHLFIGHTVCPGFADLGAKIDWWRRGAFHVGGYDYFHEGLNYRYTPVELAPYRHTPIRVAALERAARKGRGGRIALVYRNPLDQAASYHRYCQDHRDPTYSTLRGKPLAGVPFLDYLFERGLPSYARQFFSFQAMAKRHPDLVRLVPYERLIDQPVSVITAVLDHLAGAPQARPHLADAVWLARSEHMKALEKELGRSLDGTRNGRLSHIGHANARRRDGWIDDASRNRAMAFLRSRGIDLDLFEWPAARKAAAAA